MGENDFTRDAGTRQGVQPKADPASLLDAVSMESAPPDFEKLNSALSSIASIASSTLEAAPADDVSGGLLGQLARDITGVLKRMAGIEESLTRLGLRIDQVEVRVYETG